MDSELSKIVIILRSLYSVLLRLSVNTYCLYLFIRTIYLGLSRGNKVYINTTDSANCINTHSQLTAFL